MFGMAKGWKSASILNTLSKSCLAKQIMYNISKTGKVPML
jgi:hypothetical protein